MSNPAALSWLKESNQGVVVTATRRHVYVYDSTGTIQTGIAPSQDIDTCVGDRVRYEREGNRVIIQEVIPRKNLLRRSNIRISKNLAANLDRVFLVTAVGPLLNTLFVDRVQVAAAAESIPVTIVLNKVDLGFEKEKSFIETYTRLGFDFIRLSATEGKGMSLLEEHLQDDTLAIAAFCGVSGVGKSTILNSLVPHAERRTRGVSPKTGQGRQTTSQARGYFYSRSGADDLLLIDLPGIQNFGVAHLDYQDLVHAFYDLLEHSDNCEYRDCRHRAEQNCAVKIAIEKGEVSESRYHSYLHILLEIEKSEMSY